ncbi:hypothetical protein BG842_06950 [Haladaptatus sp. W1]|nr:hypothetical protein BG842_06950 [Haladaptatus sp. W1]
MLADGIAVDLVRADAGHQVFGHVVDGNSVLVGCGVLVALVGDVNESGGIDVEGELVGLCALLYCLVTNYNIVKKHLLNSKPLGKKCDSGKTILRSGAQYYV